MKKLAILCVMCISGMAFASAKHAENFVRQLSDDVFGILNSTVSDDAKEAELRNMFDDYVDAEHMAKNVLADALKTATPEQTARYIGLYKDYLTYSYVPKFRSYTGEGMDILSVAPNVSGAYIVNTTLNADGDTIAVDYLIKKAGGKYKLIDIVAEGVSIVSTQQSDFGAFAKRKGLDTFLKLLEKKVNKLK